MRSRWIKSIGIEVECGICVDLLHQSLAKFNDSRVIIDSDGSVSVERPKTIKCNWVYNAEIKFWVRINEFKKMEEFLRMLWEECGAKQNRTCGNHIHVRFINHDDVLTLIATNPKYFVKRFVDEYVRWGKSAPTRLSKRLLARLHNDFCYIYEYDEDIYYNIMGTGSRYHVVNFESLYESQNTVEFRVFPFVDGYRTIVKFMRWLVRTLDRILNEMSIIENPVTISITSNDVEEEVNEELRKLIDETEEGELDVL